MKCNQWVDRMSSYIDNELDKALTHELKVHLTECPSCNAALLELKQIKELCGSLPEQSLPDGLHNRMMSAVTQSKPPISKKYHQVSRILAPIAAALLLVFMGRGIMSLQKSPEFNNLQHFITSNDNYNKNSPEVDIADGMDNEDTINMASIDLIEEDGIKDIIRSDQSDDFEATEQLTETTSDDGSFTGRDILLYALAGFFVFFSLILQWIWRKRRKR